MLIKNKSLLIEDKDFYYDESSRIVLTEAFHKKRGFCCGNKCKHCPYEHINAKKED